MAENRLSELFGLYYQKAATEVEREELLELLRKADPAVLGALILQAGEGLADVEEVLPVTQSEQILQAILQQKTPVRRLIWRRLAVAASVILVLGTGAYFAFFQKNEQPGIAHTDPNDIPAPQATRAMITLADGRQVSIDSLKTLTQNNVSLTKTGEGQLIYNGNATETVYNTLTNPRGSTVIDMMLADGSRVWLNAGSSVTYPVSFRQNERKVTITGEAYFEASPSPSEGGGKRPFIVSKGDMSVTVLGTKFNVNAYDDEADIKVTLLEGLVRVQQGAQQITLVPGQQARVGAALEVVSGADEKEVMAWKNGYFQFNDASVQTIMRQLARWYDLDIRYEGSSMETFKGRIPRDVSLSNALKILEGTGWMQFRRNERAITVRL